MRRVQLLVSAWVVALSLMACSKTEPQAEVVRAVRTRVVEALPTRATAEFAAEVRARTESRLGFRVGGKIVSRAVNLGDAVAVGQTLAQLDPEDLRLGSEAANAAWNAAKANFAQAEADYKRFKELRDQDFISSAELERRETALKAAKAALDQAAAQARTQGNQASYAVLKADVAGVITGVDAEPGQVVSAGASVVRLALNGPRDAVFSVSEDRVEEIRALVGRPKALQVRLWGDREPLPAAIREVAAAADPTTRTYLVKADLGRAEVKLGQTATVLMGGVHSADVLHIPLTALVEHDGRSHVWLLDTTSMTVKPTPVQVAGADATSVLVTDGLQPGQVIVTAGVHVLVPGQKVTQYQAPQVPGSEHGAPAASSAAPAASK